MKDRDVTQVPGDEAPPPDSQEKERASRHAARDHSFDTIYRAYHPTVVAYLSLALSCAHDVEDVTQQVFISVLYALPRFEGSSTDVERWLVRIVRNQTINHLKSRRRSTCEEPASIDRRRENLQRRLVLGSMDWGANAGVHKCFEELPASQRQVLVLRYLLDLTHGEIAEVLGRTQASVRQINRRALASLERQLLPADEGPDITREQDQVGSNQPSPPSRAFSGRSIPAQIREPARA